MNDKGVLQTCLSPAWGGLEMVAFELAQKLKARGTHGLTVCLKDSPLARELHKAGLPSLEVMRPNKYLAPKCIRALRAELRTGKYASVLVHQMFELFQVVPALRGLKTLPLIGISHTFLGVSKKDLIHRLLYARMDKIVALTGIHKKNLLENLPVSESQLTVLPNTVDLNKFNPANRSEKFRQDFAPENGLLIGVISRLDLGKGVREVIQVAKRLREMNVKFRMLLIGRETIGEEGAKALLENDIRNFSLENEVKLIGHRSDIQSVVASLDALLMPSPFETFGRVLIEAMASGVPVVASGGGGVPDIVLNRENGILTAPIAVEEMAEGLRAYAEDPGLRKRMAENGLKRAHEIYDVEKVDAELYRLLKI